MIPTESISSPEGQLIALALQERRAHFVKLIDAALTEAHRLSSENRANAESFTRKDMYALLDQAVERYREKNRESSDALIALYTSLKSASEKTELLVISDLINKENNMTLHRAQAALPPGHAMISHHHTPPHHAQPLAPPPTEHSSLRTAAPAPHHRHAPQPAEPAPAASGSLIQFMRDSVWDAPGKPLLVTLNIPLTVIPGAKTATRILQAFEHTNHLGPGLTLKFGANMHKHQDGTETLSYGLNYAGMGIMTPKLNAQFSPLTLRAHHDRPSNEHQNSGQWGWSFSFLSTPHRDHMAEKISASMSQDASSREVGVTVEYSVQPSTKPRAISTLTFGRSFHNANLAEVKLPKNLDHLLALLSEHREEIAVVADRIIKATPFAALPAMDELEELFIQNEKFSEQATRTIVDRIRSNVTHPKSHLPAPPPDHPDPPR